MESNTRAELKDTNFSIICNNCLGGFIYQYYDIEYRTPMLGLFIPARDYVKFLADIKSYLSKKLEFIEPKESKDYESFKQVEHMMTFPIARLGDIEVYFMHYKDREEAESKWYRRINKINWDELIVIMAENESCSYEVVKQFDALPFKNKVSFTTTDYPDVKTACYIPEKKEPGSKWSAEMIVKHFDLNGFINNRAH